MNQKITNAKLFTSSSDTEEQLLQLKSLNLQLNIIVIALNQSVLRKSDPEAGSINTPGNSLEMEMFLSLNTEGIERVRHSTLPSVKPSKSVLVCSLGGWKREDGK